MTSSDTVDQQLHRLATRLLAGQYPGEVSTSSSRIFVGQLPDRLPFDIPLPDNCQVLGSYVNPQWHEIKIEFDTNSSPDRVYEFYRSRLLNQGWFEREDDYNSSRSGGFQNRYETSSTKLFCHSEQGPSLAVTPSIVNEVTEVKLSLNDDPDNGSCLVQPPRFAYGDLSTSIPRLLPPDDATFYRIRSGGDREDYYQSVSLLADLDLAAIAAHFAIQLEQGGWNCRDQGQGESLAWSSWAFQTVENRNGQATFLARKKLETPSQYLLDLLLELA